MHAASGTPGGEVVRSLAQMISMDGRRVIVTGAATGIGLAIARRFGEAGAGLVLLDVSGEELAVAAAGLAKEGMDVESHVLDLGDRAAIMSFWEEQTVPPGILINNAGVYPFMPFLAVDEAFLQRTMRVNLESAFWMCQQFIKQRRHVGGAIVNLSSIEALLPFKSQLISYGISKAGVLALTRSIARDYGRQGFRANVLVPGGIRTSGTQRLRREAITTCNFNLMRTGHAFRSRLPLGRWGLPDEVARVALFLASDLAAYVTGAIIPVDGGFLSD